MLLLFILFTLNILLKRFITLSKYLLKVINKDNKTPSMENIQSFCWLWAGIYSQALFCTTTTLFLVKYSNSKKNWIRILSNIILESLKKLWHGILSKIRVYVQLI